MKGKFDRLLRILKMLDQREACSAKDLAEEVGRDIRTVYRYMRSLDEAGFQIYYDRKRESYSFEDGFQLRKAKLNADEVLALAIAKTQMSSLGKTFSKAVDSVEKKVLDVTKKGFVPSSTIFVSHHQETQAEIDVSNLLKDLANATIEHNLVHLKYLSMHAQELTERDVEPYYLYFSPDGFWNLRAYCRLRSDWRTFALDRVQKWKILDKYFIPKLLGDDIGREVTRGFETYVDGEPEEIIVQFSPEIRPYVERRVWHLSQKNKDLPDGWLEMSFTTTGVEAIKYWLYRWIPYFRVVSPVWLRDQMIEDLEAQIENLDVPVE